MTVFRNPQTGYSFNLEDGNNREVPAPGLSPDTIDTTIEQFREGGTGNSPQNIISTPSAPLPVDPSPITPLPANPQIDQEAILQQIISDWQSGNILDVETVINRIMQGLGIDRNEALGFYGVIQPDLTRNEGVIPPETITQPGFTEGPEFLPREELFVDQSRRDQLDRLQSNAFGDFLAPTGRRAANRLTNRFLSQEPLLDFGLERGQRPQSQVFQEFLQNRPTQQTLQSGREQISGFGADSPLFEEFAFGAANNRRTNPAGDIFGTSIQPFLASLAPGLRGNLESILTNRFNTRRVRQPEQFQTQDQLFRLFNEFQGIR